MIKLRQAVDADAPAIQSLTRAAYAKWVAVIGREPRPMAADYAAAVRKHRFDLMYLDDTLDGLALAGLIETIAEPDHLLIENVAVAPAFQGQGFGRRLMAHAEHLAASSGYDRIRLYTNKHFAENVQLYLRLGYDIDREEAFRGGTTVYMSKSIPRRPAA